jgi:hypothetical protein
MSCPCPLFPRKRTFDRRCGVSAKAKSGLMQRSKIRPSFDHFVGAAEQRSIFVSCWMRVRIVNGE